MAITRCVPCNTPPHRQRQHQHRPLTIAITNVTRSITFSTLATGVTKGTTANYTTCSPPITRCTAGNPHDGAPGLTTTWTITPPVAHTSPTTRGSSTLKIDATGSTIPISTAGDSATHGTTRNTLTINNTSVTDAQSATGDTADTANSAHPNTHSALTGNVARGAPITHTTPSTLGITGLTVAR